MTLASHVAGRAAELRSAFDRGFAEPVELDAAVRRLGMILDLPLGKY